MRWRQVEAVRRWVLWTPRPEPYLQEILPPHSRRQAHFAPLFRCVGPPISMRILKYCDKGHRHVYLDEFLP